jgi:hypothetical protein
VSEPVIALQIVLQVSLEDIGLLTDIGSRALPERAL